LSRCGGEDPDGAHNGIFVRTLILLVLTLSSCEAGPRSAERSARLDTFAVERNRCIVPPGLALSDSLAIRCAELFVSQQGYTEAPPVSDTTKWVYEFMDVGVRERRATVAPDAYAICGSNQDEYVRVIFRHAPGIVSPPLWTDSGIVASPPTGRAVRLSPNSSTMEFQHQDAYLPDSTFRDCRRRAAGQRSVVDHQRRSQE
jgi:hypothetical protein